MLLLTERSEILLLSLLQKKHLSTLLLWCSRYKFNTIFFYSLTTYIPSIIFPSASLISYIQFNTVMQFACTYGIFDTWSVLFGGKIFWKFLDPGFLNRCKGECVKSFVRLFSYKRERLTVNTHYRYGFKTAQ